MQQNTLERLIIFIPSLWICSYCSGQKVAAARGVVFIVARAVYGVVYGRSHGKRSPILGIGGLANTARMVGSDRRGSINAISSAMRKRFKWLLAGMLASCALAVLGAAVTSAPVFKDPKPFREYESFEGYDAEAPIPDDWQVPGEFVVGRLMYPSAGGGRGFFGGGYDWHQGGTGWTDDYPRGDRALIQMIKRNTRINVRSVEQPVAVDDPDDMAYYPFLVAGLAQSWQLTNEEAGNLREYLLRGGFLFCDSFYQEDNWYYFEESMKRVFPEYEIRDLTDEEAVFHIAFEMKGMTKVKIPHIREARGGFSMGDPVHWRGVFENDDPDHGRLLVLIAHNNDTGDGWQFADDPRYPSDEANRALRLGSNIVIYAMTH